MKKIDAHVHLAKVVAGYCRRGESRAIGGGKAQWGNGEVFQLIPPEIGGECFLAEQLLELMDANDVERAVLMQGSLYGFQNQYHKQLLKEMPDRFCPACTVDPYHTDHIETLRHYLEDDGFRLVKFEISSGGGLMGTHEPIDISGNRMMEIFKLIEANGGNVALDVGDITMESHQPYAIMRVADRCPDLKITVCHLLAPMREKHKEWRVSLELLSKPNVWFDIAAIPKIFTPDPYPYHEAAAYLKEAKHIIGADRMMWGTDAPFAATLDTYEHLSDYLEKVDAFTQEELADVYYNTARKVYFD